MDKQVIFLKVDSEIKQRLQDIAKAERRSMTSIILLLIERKLRERENAGKD